MLPVFFSIYGTTQFLFIKVLTFFPSSTPPIHFTNHKLHELDIYYIMSDRLIDLVGREFANGLGDPSSVPGRVIPKTLKMVLDTSLLNTQQNEVHIKGKVEQSRERSSALSYTLV